MRQKVLRWVMALSFVAVTGGATLTVATPQTTLAACNDRLLTFPAWYKGLVDADCNVKDPTQVGGISTFVWTIVLNCLEIGLQIVGYLAVGYIIRGGFKYMTAVGEPAEIQKAKSIIENAVIGLILSIFSVAIVNFAAGAISG